MIYSYLCLLILAALVIDAPSLFLQFVAVQFTGKKIKTRFRRSKYYFYLCALAFAFRRPCFCACAQPALETPLNPRRISLTTRRSAKPPPTKATARATKPRAPDRHRRTGGGQRRRRYGPPGRLRVFLCGWHRRCALNESCTGHTKRNKVIPNL